MAEDMKVEQTALSRDTGLGLVAHSCGLGKAGGLAEWPTWGLAGLVAEWPTWGLAGMMADGGWRAAVGWGRLFC